MTLAGAKDRFKEASRAAGLKLAPQPIFRNFFSELPHHPSRQVAIRPAIKLPPHVNPYASVSAAPESRASKTFRSQPARVEGTRQALYYTRPLRSHETEVSAPVKLDTGVRPVAEPIDADAAARQGRARPQDFAPPGHRTVGTQSTYRESDAQTMPWEPDYVLPETVSAKQRALMEKNHSDVPEVLYLQHLKFGDGLPAGGTEVEQIKKLRAKRAFEASLPPISGEVYAAAVGSHAATLRSCDGICAPWFAVVLKYFLISCQTPALLCKSGAALSYVCNCGKAVMPIPGVQSPWQLIIAAETWRYIACIADLKRLPERQRMLEEWETMEWAEREREIEDLQEERLAILQAALEVSLGLERSNPAACSPTGVQPSDKRRLD